MLTTEFASFEAVLLTAVSKGTTRRTHAFPPRQLTDIDSAKRCAYQREWCWPDLNVALKVGMTQWYLY